MRVIGASGAPGGAWSPGAFPQSVTLGALPLAPVPDWQLLKRVSLSSVSRSSKLEEPEEKVVGTSACSLLVWSTGQSLRLASGA